MSQLAGCLCTICGRRITGLADGNFCATCGNPVHCACAEAAQDDVSRCSACGTFSPELKAPALSGLGTSAGQIVKDLFAFRGRLSRGKFFLYSVLGGAVLAAFLFIAYPSAKAIALGQGIADRISQSEGVYAIPAFLAGFLLATWSAFAVTAKRLHAIGRPGTHCFLLLVPPYNVYLGLRLLFSPGKDGDGKSRHDPNQMRHTMIDLGPGNNLLLVASRHEASGDGDRALELYQRAADELKGGAHYELAARRLQRLRRKAAIAQETGSAE